MPVVIALGADTNTNTGILTHSRNHTQFKTMASYYSRFTNTWKYLATATHTINISKSS